MSPATRGLILSPAGGGREQSTAGVRSPTFYSVCHALPPVKSQSELLLCPFFCCSNPNHRPPSLNPFPRPTSETLRGSVAANIKVSLCASLRGCACARRHMRTHTSPSLTEECVSDHCVVVNPGFWSLPATGRPMCLSGHARP